MVEMVTRKQVGAIHALKGRAGLDDDAYRAMLHRLAAKSSSKDLTRREAITVIDHLKGRFPVLRSGLEGPFATKLQALWISAWNLGIARDRRDKALLAFVKRQTGVDNTRWLREPAEAMKAIEGLKAWLSREGGVVWSAFPEDPKRCVVEAQMRRLGLATGTIDVPDLDRVIADLGERIRSRGEAAAC